MFKNLGMVVCTYTLGWGGNLGMVVCTHTPGTGEAETGASLGLTHLSVSSRCIRDTSQKKDKVAST